jgi:hypothetical protein
MGGDGNMPGICPGPLGSCANAEVVNASMRKMDQNMRMSLLRRAPPNTIGDKMLPRTGPGNHIPGRILLFRRLDDRIITPSIQTQQVP